MSDAGSALLGIGMGTGEQRAIEAAEQAVVLAAARDVAWTARARSCCRSPAARDLSLWEVNEAAKAVVRGRPPRREHHLRRDGRREARRPGLGHRRRDRLRRAAAPRAARSRSRPASRAWSGATRAGARAGRATTAPAGSATRRAGARRDRARRAGVRCRAGSTRDAVTGIVAAGHPLTAEAGARGAARRRQRGRRGGRGDAHVVRGRAAADRPGRGRLHARRAAPARSRRCSTSSSRRRARGAERTAPAELDAGRRVASATRCRSSTSARRPCGTYGWPAGVSRGGGALGDACRWPSWPRRRRRSRARACRSTPEQAYVFAILAGDPVLDAGGRGACSPRAGGLLREGERVPQPRARRRDRAARARRAPRRSTAATIAAAVRDVAGRARRPADGRGPRRLRGGRARAGAGRLPRARGADEPAAVGGRDADRATRSALLDRRPAPPRPSDLVEVMERGAGRAHADAFLERARRDRSFADALPGRPRLGSTTHISVLDGDGRACSVTCTNGEGSGVVVPGTGLHLNNMLGEEDLNPLGFHAFERGAADAVDDGADRGAARRRGRARARQRRLQPDPLGDPADDRRRGRPRT